MKLSNWGGFFLNDITTSRFALLQTYGIFYQVFSVFFVVAYLEPLIVIKLGECHHRVSCSNVFGQLVFHGKFESCHPQNFVTMQFPVQSFWGLAIDSITFTNIFAKPMRFFLDWFAFWFSSSQQDCGLFIAIHRRNPTLKFLEPLAAEHGMIFTLQKGHLVWFKGVVGGRDVSFLVLQNGPPKSFSGELSQRFWADLLFVEWCRSSNHGLLKGFNIHFRVSLTEPRIKLPDAWWPVIRLS